MSAGFVGFDPERVAQLRMRLTLAAAGLGTLWSADPAAAPAMQRVRSAQSRLVDHWIPAVDRVLDAAAVVTDLISLGDRAVAAGSVLPDERALLTFAGRMRRADDALGLTAVRTALAGAGPALVTWLAAERLRWESRVLADPEDEEACRRLTAIDEVLASVGQVLTAGTGGSHRPAVPDMIDDLDPYSAAVLLPHLGLTGTLLGEAAGRIVRRWHDRSPSDPLPPDLTAPGDNTPDHVLRLLLGDPAASTRYLELFVDDPLALVTGAMDPELVPGVITTGLDPSVVGPVRAGGIIVPLIEWQIAHGEPRGVPHDGTVPSVRPLLAGLMADWLPYAGPRSEVWRWDWERGDRALDWLVERDDDLALFIDRLASEQAALAVTDVADTEGRVDARLVHDLAATFAQLERVLGDRRVDDAERDEMWVDLAFQGAEALVGAVLPAARAGRTVSQQVATGRAFDWLRSHLDRSGALPPSPEQTERDVRTELARRQVERATIAAAGVVGGLVDRGAVPSAVLDDLTNLLPTDAACDVRASADALHDWVDGLAPHLDPADHNLVVSVVQAFLDEQVVVEACT